MPSPLKRAPALLPLLREFALFANHFVPTVCVTRLNQAGLSIGR